MRLEVVLRNCVRSCDSIARVAKESGVPQPTLQEFVNGKPDGSFADLRLSTVQKLLDYFGQKELFFVPGHLNRRNAQMLLADELLAGECSDSPEKFKERLIETMRGFFNGYTIDGLLCNPKTAFEFCENIRSGVGSESLCDAVILKALVNIRKRKDCPRGLGSTGKRRVLKTELLSAKCEMAPSMFKQLVVDCLADMYKNRTVDEVVCHPREAWMLCNFARRKANCETLSNDLILSTLMNVRKSG